MYTRRVVGCEKRCGDRVKNLKENIPTLRKMIGPVNIIGMAPKDYRSKIDGPE